jgi:hypothetical protein
MRCRSIGLLVISEPRKAHNMARHCVSSMNLGNCSPATNPQQLPTMSGLLMLLFPTPGELFLAFVHYLMLSLPTFALFWAILHDWRGIAPAGDPGSSQRPSATPFILLPMLLTIYEMYPNVPRPLPSFSDLNPPVSKLSCAVQKTVA